MSDSERLVIVASALRISAKTNVLPSTRHVLQTEGCAHNSREIMSVAVITGSAGLVGSEAVAYFAAEGLDIVGVDNGMRGVFFGEDASTTWVRERLKREVRSYTHRNIDIRDQAEICRIFEHYGAAI